MILSRESIRSPLITKWQQQKQTNNNNNKRFADDLPALCLDIHNLSNPVYHQLLGKPYHQSYPLIVICLIFSESADVFTCWLPRFWLGLQSSLNSSLAALLHSSITCFKSIQSSAVHLTFSISCSAHVTMDSCTPEN